MNKYKKLKTYDEPTNLIVLGTDNDIQYGNCDFKITDDESSFGVCIDSEFKKNFDSDGFVSILTIDEYEKWLEDEENKESYLDPFCPFDAFLIPNFIGDIEIGVKLSDGSYDTNFDIDDYICHQYDDIYVEGICINLPKDTEIIEWEGWEIPSDLLGEVK